MDNEKGKFYIVATPIGNMGDITYRAIETLNTVDYIYAEDTRQFGKIAQRYEITTKVYPYNAHATDKTHNNIIEALLSGKNIALVSDAGTPGISDPGSMIVNFLRNNHKDVQIVPIPGASAVVSAVSVSGMFGNQFTFLGFVPHKKGRETFLNNAISSSIPVIFYESPHRIENTLKFLNENSPDTKIMIAREMTKMFETISIQNAEEHLNKIKENIKELKGEFTLIIFPK